MQTSNIRVICRFRPINEREKQADLQSSKSNSGSKFQNAQITFSDTQVTISSGDSSDGSAPSSPKEANQTYAYDRVFWNPKTTQLEVYEITAKPTVEDVMNGFNGTIFAYGQTGTGKSFTMFGSDGDQDLKGIIPRSCVDLFASIEKLKGEGTETTVKCSFLEIYNENLFDLLNPSKTGALKVRETATRGVWVENLTQQNVETAEEVFSLIKEGEKSRSVSYTQMNEASSRSHTLFILGIQQKTSDGATKEGTLNLVDLAGSEQVGKTGATGATLEEAKKINQSLSALGNCIFALGKTKQNHIPYRNSKLTHILRESLGGNCKTTLLLACSPHKFNLEETISTLKFGQRAKNIKTSAVQNTKSKSPEELNKTIDNLNQEISELKEYVSHLETQVEQMNEANQKAEQTPKITPNTTGEKELEELKTKFNLMSAHELEFKQQNLVLNDLLARKDEKIKEQALQLRLLQEQYELSRSENQKLSDKVTQATQNIDNYSTTLKHYKKQLEDSERELAAAKSRPAPANASNEQAIRKALEKEFEERLKVETQKLRSQYEATESNKPVQDVPTKLAEVPVAVSPQIDSLPTTPQTEISATSEVEAKSNFDSAGSPLKSKLEYCLSYCQTILAENPKSDLERVLHEDLRKQEKQKDSLQWSESEAENLHMFLANCFMTIGNVLKEQRKLEEAQKFYDDARLHLQKAFWKLAKEAEQDPPPDPQRRKSTSSITERERAESHQENERQRRRRLTMNMEKVQGMIKDMPDVAPVIPEAEKREIQLKKSNSEDGISQFFRNIFGSKKERSRAPSPRIDIAFSDSTQNQDIGASQEFSSPQPGTSPAIPLPSNMADLRTSFNMKKSASRSATFHREAIVAELIKTERDYVNDLRIIVDVFIFPLRRRRIITLTEEKVIFSNVETLLNMNEQLLEQLEDQLELKSTDQSMQMIGEVFQRMGEYFKMYKVYCGNQDVSMKKITELMNGNIGFRMFLKEAMSIPQCRKLSLQSFLIKPVQRLCKYPILFMELVKNTPAEHPDRRKLGEVQKKFEEIVAHVNEAQRMFEVQKRILSIQNNVDGVTDLISPTRVLVREGVLTVQAYNNLRVSSENIKPIEHQVYLFNDSILFARKKDIKLLSSKEYLFVALISLGAVNFALNTTAAKKQILVDILAVEPRSPSLSRDMQSKFLVAAADDYETESWYSVLIQAYTDAHEKNQSQLRRSLSSTSVRDSIQM